MFQVACLNSLFFLLYWSIFLYGLLVAFGIVFAIPFKSEVVAMKQEFPEGTWFRFVKAKFDDEIDIPLGKIGRYLGHDDWLPTLWSYPNHRWSIKPFYLERLNGQLAFLGAGQGILQVLELFYKAETDVKSSAQYLSKCYDLLVALPKAFRKSCPLVARELEMAIINLDDYRSDVWENYKSAEFFFEHMGNAISYMLGSS